VRGTTRPKQAWVACPTGQAAPPGPIFPSNDILPPSFYGCLCLRTKPTPYLSHIFCGSGRGGTLLLVPEALICCCHQKNRCHHFSRNLFSVGGASSSPPSSSPTTAPSPLRNLMSSPRYYLSVVCMFVLSSLS
jgi:hypothetical protein